MLQKINAVMRETVRVAVLVFLVARELGQCYCQ